MVLLGIARIQNEVVGDASQRGISGGQRKRVNVGECASHERHMCLWTSGFKLMQ
jgi:hypothetical protein